MSPPIPIPDDVRTWLLGVFGACNNRVSTLLSQMPTTHEVPLDMTFIQHFLQVSGPRRFGSGWTVDPTTHYLGGGRHWADWPDWPRRWEIADIGILVVYRQGGRTIRSKVALLQSKRLYADEIGLDEETPLDYMSGFGRLFRADADWSNVVTPRCFSFTEGSRYQALITGPGQYEAIAAYERKHSIPVYYLLYNPALIPSRTTSPIGLDQPTVPTANEVGCRVMPAVAVRAATSHRPPGSSPEYQELASGGGHGGAPRRRLAAGGLRCQPTTGVRGGLCGDQPSGRRPVLRLQPAERADFGSAGDFVGCALIVEIRPFAALRWAGRWLGSLQGSAPRRRGAMTRQHHQPPFRPESRAC